MGIETGIEQLLSYLWGLLPKGIDFVLSAVIAFLILFFGTKLAKKFLGHLKKSLLKKEMEPGAISFIISAGKVLLYAMLIVISAQILGFATSSIVAIVGSAGLAIGLALQGSLANFAGGVLILMMKPFVVGDYIIVGDVEGNVQKIDIVYTTLHTIDNRAVILPNGKLADSNIVNVTKEDKRRIDLKIGIEYSENIKRVRDVLQQIVDRQDNRLKDMPVDIVVSSLAESAVIMELHMWVAPEDYWVTRWKMIEEVKEDFDANHIAIPFNQLDVNLHTVANGKLM